MNAVGENSCCGVPMTAPVASSKNSPAGKQGGESSKRVAADESMTGKLGAAESSCCAYTAGSRV